MNKQLACHYSVARFRPYPETDEFVNVGVVLACPATGYFDFMRADLRRHGRVGRFFPELDAGIYSAAMHAWEDSLKDWRNSATDGQTLADFDRQLLRDVFKDAVRPRDNILFYSETRAILSDNPAVTLKEVFSAYVERRFAQAQEYQEGIMCERLKEVFSQCSLLGRYRLDEKVGNEIYEVRFPFVKPAQDDARPLQAIKALHLDRERTTDIFRRADEWLGVVNRLRGYKTAPEELLFVLQGPRNRSQSHIRAFDQVRRDLDGQSIPHVTADATQAILSFARKGE